jgi:hypothetical protein
MGHGKPAQMREGDNKRGHERRLGEIEGVLRQQADVARRAKPVRAFARREDTSPRLFREFGFVDQSGAPLPDRGS